MKIVADEFGIKVLDIPAKINVPSPMFDVVMDLSVTAKRVRVEGNTVVIPLKEKQKQ